MHRKYPLETDSVYHVFNKSIADFKIFNEKKDFLRIFEVAKYYQFEKVPLSFSRFIRARKERKKIFSNSFLLEKNNKLVEIIAYCFMPTHIHLALKQVKDNGISVFMNKVLDSYTRYFNLSHKRKGPLWEGPFKNVLVESDDQLYHLTRYIHLNPVTAYLVDKSEDWDFSSYREYLGIAKDKVCKYDDLFEIDTASYKKFVEDRVSYQRELQRIKILMLD